ncbi:MAG: Gfo/Idh/MocA family oxidoreductase [Spirochaetales bacterium]|nr:Gfo/Idh/MocA family oxidoreductase [Spirochaetales bacterium]
MTHGKHVLCEKPITVNADEFKPLVKLAEKKGLFLMEAMWSRFLPAFKKLREWIDEGKLGAVKRIEADFSFDFPYDPQHRIFNPELAGGALLDIGIYPITLAIFVMGRKPDEIVSLHR